MVAASFAGGRVALRRVPGVLGFIPARGGRVKAGTRCEPASGGERIRLDGSAVFIGVVVLESAIIAVGTGFQRFGRAEDARSGVTNERALDFFSSTYQSARGRFIEAARAIGGTVECIPNPHRGPHGGQLFMDVALIGATEATRTLVVSSGTHGVEGFAGSGIQTGLLQEGINSRLPEGVSVLLIHALNPYGMAHLRRFTEDNVDLNRNFRDHSGPHPRNLPYETLAEVIAPQSLSFCSELRSWSRLLWHRLTAGKAASQAAVSGGQYSHPRWSVLWRHVRNLVKHHLSSGDPTLPFARNSCRGSGRSYGSRGVRRC